MSVDWDRVCDVLAGKASSCDWKYGQGDTVAFLAGQLRTRPGVLIADEVGLGKTRVALAAVDAVLDAGGTAAVVAPPGLLFQWQREWQRFGGRQRPIILSRFRDLFAFADEAPAVYPRAQAGGWLLVSHRFGTPRLKSNSRIDRFRLPLLARAIRADGGAVRHSWGTRDWVRQQLDGVHDCEEAAAEFIARSTALSEAIDAFEVRHLLDRHDGDAWSDEASAYLSAEGAGRRCLQRCYRHLVGSLDLLVIDEAHKARAGSAAPDEEASDESQLSELLNRLIHVRGKRIAMTATPVELDAAQWQSVLHRIGLKDPPMNAIAAFCQAHAKADRHPDQAAAITELIAASRTFQEALANVVTRRRRIRQAAMRHLVGDAHRPHPHRETSEPILIRFGEISERWRPAVVAMEGISRAAAGCAWAGGRIKRAATRYASGMIGHAIDADELEGERPDDPIEGGRWDRIAYWKRQIAGVAGASDSPTRLQQLADHPRILAVVDRIDRALWDRGSDRGKILVFGVNLEPLRALRDALNRRAVLRLLDNGLPAPGGERSLLADAEAILEEYRRITEVGSRSVPRLRRLRIDGERGIDDLRELLRDGARAYEEWSSRLQKAVNDEWVLAVVLRAVPGAPSHLVKKVAAWLRAQVLGDALAAAELEGRGVPAFDRTAIRDAAERTWNQILAAHVEADQDEERSEDGAGQLTLDHLRGLLDDDAADGARGGFARLLAGDSRMETRRRLQAKFNDPQAYPRVLIAQSEVGREGLNLHESCSHVILFQPEWNPATVEQQIGRVDRIDSKWERDARRWVDAGRVGPMPMIRVERVVFEGTYDEHQHRVLERRRRDLHAQLFGDLLSEDSRGRVPAALLEQLANAAPDFSPPSIGSEEHPRLPSRY